MSYQYATAARKRMEGSSKRAGGERARKGGSMDALRSLAAKNATSTPGTPVDLPDAVRSKFEASFGTDLSAVKLYRSQAVADAGAKAVAQGARVTFAPGLLDFSSRRGQELLGHELSHVVARQRGEVSGSGFMHDSAQESRADREGAKAAAGEQVSAPTAPLSSASAASSAGPMQASLDDETKKKLLEEGGGADDAGAEAAGEEEEETSPMDLLSGGMEVMKNIGSYRKASGIQSSMAANAADIENQRRNNGGQLSEDQEKMQKIFNQGAGKARIDKIQGGFDIAKSALGLGSKIANFAGAKPIGSGLDKLSTAVGIVGKGVNDYETDKFHESTVEDELHTKENVKNYEKDDDTSHIWGEIGDEAKKTAFLRHKGYTSGKTGEAFESITKDRTNHIMDKASDEDREKFMNSAQINVKAEEGESEEDVAKKKRAAVHSALGGSDAEYSDMFGDEFEEAANANQEAIANKKAAKAAEAEKMSKMTGGEKAKYRLQKAGKWIKGAASTVGSGIKKGAGWLWGKIKGLGSKIASGAKKVGKGIVSGAKAVGSGIKTFIQNPKEVLKGIGGKIANGAMAAGRGIANGAKAVGRGIVSGAKAVGRGAEAFINDPRGTLKNIGSSIASGAKKAGSYIGGMVKTQTNKVKNWYNHGMEQLVMNKGNYDKMSRGQRFLWTLKNLPARLAYNSKKARDKTAGRMADVLKAQALMRYTDEKRNKKAS